jgi:hypothetical protein
MKTINNIKCTGNNGNGCFMDSCAIDCGCEGLKEFAEKLKNRGKMEMKRTVLQDVEELIEGQHLFEIGKLFERLHQKYSKEYDIVCLEGFNVVGYN